MSAQTYQAKLSELLNASPSSQACRDLAKALQVVLTLEKQELASDIYTKDILPAIKTGKSRLNALKGLASKTATYVQQLKSIGEQQGAEKALNQLRTDSAEAISSGKEAAVALYENAKTFIPEARKRTVGFIDQIVQDYERLETDEEKLNYVLKLSAYLVVLGYGVHLGHQVPDMDFALWGAGAHRSFLSHSVAPMLAVTTASILLTRLLERAERHLPPNSDAKVYSDNIKFCLGLFTVGFGAGLTFHLAVDTVWDTGGTIRIHDLSGNTLGSIVKGTRIDDYAYTTAMSLFSGDLTHSSSEKNRKLGA